MRVRSNSVTEQQDFWPFLLSVREKLTDVVIGLKTFYKKRK